MTENQKMMVNRQQSVERAFETVLRVNLEAVEAWEPIAFDGTDIEGVHKVRVGLRRMRSALTVFGLAIPRSMTRPLAKKLRWAARQLDRARDLDVYIDETLSAAPDTRAADRLRAIAFVHREKAYRRVRKLLQGKRYARIKSDLIQWLDSNSWRDGLSVEEGKAVRRRVTPFSAQVLDKHRTQVLEDGEEIHRLDSEALHQLRIDCKKLRYATEFFAPLYGARMQDFTLHLKALQDLLGTLHDVAVIGGLHRAMLKGSGDSKVKRLARQLEDMRAKEAEHIMVELVDRWVEFAEARIPWVPAPRKVSE